MQLGYLTVAYAELDDGAYAAGLVLSTYRGQPLIWHSGANDGFRSSVLIQPLAQRAVAITCNSARAGDTFAVALSTLQAWFGIEG